MAKTVKLRQKHPKDWQKYTTIINWVADKDE